MTMRIVGICLLLIIIYLQYRFRRQRWEEDPGNNLEGHVQSVLGSDPDEGAKGDTKELDTLT